MDVCIYGLHHADNVMSVTGWLAAVPIQSVAEDLQVSRLYFCSAHRLR